MGPKFIPHRLVQPHKGNLQTERYLDNRGFQTRRVQCTERLWRIKRDLDGQIVQLQRIQTPSKIWDMCATAAFAVQCT
jgi:hypothetical protein